MRRAISKGQPILGKLLIEPGKTGFLAVALGSGMRAMSNKITAETGAASFILPGDRVDVVLTQVIRQTQGEDAGRDKVISETVVNVLADTENHISTARGILNLINRDKL